jgi:hypothetical protein
MHNREGFVWQFSSATDETQMKHGFPDHDWTDDLCESRIASSRKAGRSPKFGTESRLQPVKHSRVKEYGNSLQPRVYQALAA